MLFFSKTSSEFVESRKSELGCELVGSWTVSVGDMDQALHLWRYVGGFEKIDKAKILFRENPVSDPLLDNLMTRRQICNLLHTFVFAHCTADAISRSVQYH